MGPWTLARNAGLGGAAGLVALAGPGAAVGGSALAIGLAAVLTLQAWFSWELLRQHGRLLERILALEAAADAAPPANLAVIHRHRVRPGSLDQRVRALGG